MGTTTVIYTYIGGMKAVIWTDCVQFTIYILGALVALLILVGKLPGGWNELINTAEAGHKFHLFDFSTTLTRPFTFWAGLIGGMFLNTASHGADQMMVQRYLSARSQRQAAGALIASGFVILAQFSLFLFIGVSLWVFYQVAPPTGGGELRPDQAFAYFIVHHLPVGVSGLVIAAIFAAAMGTLASSLNASASSTVNDLYRPLVPKADEAHLVRVSKGMTALWGVVKMGVAYGATGLRGSVVTNALEIASFVTGIILGLFLLGILTRRVGQAAALVGLLAGIGAVTYVKFATPLAWPWYALVGSSTVFLVGLGASLVLPVSKPAHVSALEEV
jgi:SSS family transporter